jgi:hypothetical protein
MAGEVVEKEWKGKDHLIDDFLTSLWLGLCVCVRKSEVIKLD